MRSARPVGLSQDGRSLIVATSTGEELSVAVDERFHAALRGDQPRLGQLEIEMENSLTPRDIQSRIRAGQSLEEVGRVAGLPLDRVERFAAPVLAEREHIALLAMSSSVRRRGETSGHRLLRLAVTERLVKRGVDIDSVDWDAFRREDGRWSVTASYSSGDSSRQAVFVFDLQARFSVADDDEARWVLGEQSPLKGPQPGRRRPSGADGEGEEDTEPTLDLSDQLALVRVIQPPHELRESGADAAQQHAGRQPGGADRRETGTAGDNGGDLAPLAAVRGLYSVPNQVETDDEVEPDDEVQPEDELEPDDEVQPEDELDPQTDSELDQDHESNGEAEARHQRDPDGPLDQHDPPLAYGGLSDASAVPETDNSGWEPAIVVDYPVEPSPEAAEDEAQREGPADGSVSYQGVLSDQPPGPTGQPARLSGDAPDRHGPNALHGTDTPGPPERIVDGEDRAEEAEELAEEQAAKASTPRPAGKRKRAAVPSWDEIMFGGPPRPR